MHFKIYLKKHLLLTIFLCILLIYSCSHSTDAEPTPALSLLTPTPLESLKSTDNLPACDQPDITKSNTTGIELQGIEDWINSQPLTINGELANNRVVLIDFWTYTCVNCIRTLPFIHEWHNKYSDKGLTIIGVHTPEFEFEKIKENIEHAAASDGVVWPIAIDNNYDTWRTFENRYWPAKYLITSDGVVYSHFGEGAYCETERAIRAALTQSGWDVTDIPIGEVNFQKRDSSAFTQTREIYAGRIRSTPYNPYAGNFEYYSITDTAGGVIQFQDPGEYANNYFYLHGPWKVGSEQVVHARETKNLEDYIALTFLSKSVNVVINSSDEEQYKVYVYLDDKPLQPLQAGHDIQFDSQGNSYILVDTPKLYSIVIQPQFRESVLKLSSNSSKFGFFAFTFGTYEEGI